MKSRIGELVRILSIAKSRGAKLLGKSVFEKELKQIMDAPDVVLPVNNPGIYDENGLATVPEIYER